MTATRGLEGVVAAQSKISSIIDDTLTYVGYSIDDLTNNATFEEVIYLLWHTRLPKEDELAELKQQLAENMEIPVAITAIILIKRFANKLAFSFPSFCITSLKTGTNVETIAELKTKSTICVGIFKAVKNAVAS